MSTLFTYVRIVLFGRAMASADSNHSLLSTLKREPKTAECAEIAGLITWQAAFVFLECFLSQPQLDANYIIMQEQEELVVRACSTLGALVAGIVRVDESKQAELLINIL